MKSRQYRYGCFLMCISLILISCTKTEFLPDLKGNMVGYVYTFKEFERSIPKDNSGVTVTALGMKEYRTTSDKNGRFEFTNLPAGTYELQMHKNGFGTLKKAGIKHLGGEPTILNMPFNMTTNTSAFFIYELPATEITEMKIEHDSLFCKFSFPGSQPDLVCIQLYISGQDNFESDSADLIFRNFNMGMKDGFYAGLLSHYTGAYDLHSGLPYKSGEKIFFKARTSPYYGLSVTFLNSWYLTGIDTYFDYENNRVVYPALGKESAQYSYIIP
jgi:hypothetical protein